MAGSENEQTSESELEWIPRKLKEKCEGSGLMRNRLQVKGKNNGSTDGHKKTEKSQIQGTRPGGTA